MNEKARIDTAEQAEFRKYCSDWIAATPPAPLPPPAERRSQTHPGRKSQVWHDYQLAWQLSAYEGGLVGCDYPTEYGGGGRNDCQRVANQELQRVGTPDFPSITGLRFGAATILEHGSEFIKKRFIPKMLSGEEQWCQGFSEPNAGSDVANQETFAEPDGDAWVINGQKIWTSFAEWADWMLLLCRTDRTDKHRGLTYFCVPIKANLGKSVEVRPLVQINGEAHFNEVFFDDLTIEDNYRLDEVGQGWSVAMTTLKFERSAGSLVEPAAGSPPNPDESRGITADTPIIRLAKNSKRFGKSVADDSVFRDRIVQVLIRRTGFEQANRRAQTEALVDNPMRIPMQAKLVDSEIRQDMAALGVEIEGASSTLAGIDENAPPGGWPMQYIGSCGGTLASGSSEIQRNQLGERILGMPKTK